MSSKKYKLIKDNFIEIDGHKLYRIQAIKDFGDVKAGDIGGYIQNYKNLSHSGTCWVYEEAKVFGNAEVSGNAKVKERAIVYGEAKISDDAKIYGYATIKDNVKIYEKAKVYDYAKVYGFVHVYGTAKIHGGAEVFGNVKVYGNAKISDYAEIRDNAEIYGNAKVSEHVNVFDNAKIYGNSVVYGGAVIHENAKIYGNAKVYDEAKIFGRANVYDNAKIFDEAKVQGGVSVYGNAKVYGKVNLVCGHVTNDIFDNMENLIYYSFNIFPDENGDYIFYKRVNKISDGVYCSLYDENFIYEIGKVIEEKDYDHNYLVSCSRGLHVSLPDYWDEGDTLIQVKVNIKDIITCLDGKVRCKRLKVLREIPLEPVIGE